MWKQAALMHEMSTAPPAPGGATIPIENGQMDASSFAGRVPIRGLVFIPAYAHIIPIESCRNFCPTAEEIAAGAKKPFLMYGELGHLCFWPEHETDRIRPQEQGVEAHAAKMGMEFGFKLPYGTPLRRRGYDNVPGIATTNSAEDGHYAISRVSDAPLTAVLEYKPGDTSVLMAFRQCTSYASLIGMRQLHLGIPREEVVVPIVGTNGSELLVGAMVFLEPSQPLVMTLSKALVISDPHDNAIISAFLTKIQSHNIKMGKRIAESKPLRKRISMCFNPRAYHIKVYTSAVCENGLGLFGDTDDYEYLEPGLRHMFRVLTLLYASPPCRSIVEFPLGLRTPDGEIKNYCLIFQDLKRLGYRQGAPNRFMAPDQYAMFVKAVEYAVEQFDIAGVVHGDMYASNFMWRVNTITNDMEIKVVDWDVAHCLDEGEYRGIPWRRLDENNRCPDLFKGRDAWYAKVWRLEVDMDDDDVKLWTDLALSSSEEGILLSDAELKSRCDFAFSMLVSRVLMDWKKNVTG